MLRIKLCKQLRFLVQGDAYGAIVSKVKAFTRSNGVHGASSHACRGLVSYLKLANNPMVRRPRGQRAEGTVSRKHPTVAAQQHRMLHHRGGHHKGPYCKVARGLIGSTKLDVQAVARRSSQRGKFTKTTPGSRSVFPFASNGCGPRREYPVQHFAPDEGMRGTSVEERHATKRRDF